MNKLTFKQFLEEEEDVYHKVPKQAAEAFLKHCTQWKDIENPLYRISTPPDGGSHAMRTRSPRKRKYESVAGSRDVQQLLFNQPGWGHFPDRLHSIFCSTKKEFAVGEIDGHSENLICIYPFDGTEIAMTVEDIDFNYLNLLRSTRASETNGVHLMDFNDFVTECYMEVTGKFNWAMNWKDKMEFLKETFAHDNKFDPSAGGNAQVAEYYRDTGPDTKLRIQALVLDIPNTWTPEKLGVELVTPSTIDLPGKTRECWFSGKYLSIPYLDWKQFKAEVEALQKGEELPEKSTIRTRAPGQ